MSSTRRSFVANSLLAAVASAIVPRSLKALTPCVPHGTRAAASTVLDLFSPTSPAPPATYNPSYFAIVDLHCHPSLKMYLWGRKLWHYHTAGLGVNAFDLQDDMAQLSTGTVPHDPAGPQYDGLVKGVVVAHYLPEAAIGEQWDVLKKIYPWIGRLFRGVTDKIEHGDATNITQIIAIIDLLNTQAEKASRKNHGVPFVIARSFQEFDDAIRDGKFPIAHAIEGAHALGRNKAQFRGRNKQPEQGTMQLAGQEAAAQYIRNLELLKSKGVCMMTLAHLFPNDIAACVEGISPDEKHSIGMGWHYTADDNLPLTNVGEAVVDWMLLKGMIVDLTHSTPKARAQIFDMNQKYHRPLVFTHTGAEGVFMMHDRGQFLDYRYYCVSDEEVARICACGGTIGVIPEVFWLAGGDTHLRHYGLSPRAFRNGIPYMVETIKYINARTPDQDYNNISIGTDFDGFSDEPQDLYEASQLDALIEALRAEKISDGSIRKIMSGNALRVLQCGWG